MPYHYLGIEDSELLRETEEERVQRYKDTCLGWETALAVAAKFSNGQPCEKGQGAGKMTNKPVIEGGYNVCYWVKIASLPTEWVVRFPKLGMMDDKLTRLRLRSEVATLKFLQSKTKIPVPKVIGYGEGEDSIPAFIILESINGVRMDLLHKIAVSEGLLEDIMEDLARIQLELLSIPFDRIGMLDINDVEQSEICGSPPVPTLGPCSLDSWELDRNGVFPGSIGPLSSSLAYYNHKFDLWKHQLNTQSNSVEGEEDGRRKLLNKEILSQLIPILGPPTIDDCKRFYLAHPDLHATNIIVDEHTFRVIGIIDWEGACTLPVTSFWNPPFALTSAAKHELYPGCPDLAIFQRRSAKYNEIVAELQRAELPSTTNYKSRQTSETLPISKVGDESMFLAWALDDIRYLDHIVWQHLATHLHVDLQTRITSTTEDVGSDSWDETIRGIIDEFVMEREPVEAGWQEWLQKKLSELSGYDAEVDIRRKTQRQEINEF